MVKSVENRTSERSNLHIFATLIGYETNEQKWEEKAEIFNLSKNSVGLSLNRKCQIGRLLLITAPIPLNLRGDDRTEPDYSVWGIIQNCTLMGKKGESEDYYIGLALIGSAAPPSFFENPSQNYRLCGLNEVGFWTIEETGRVFKPRKYPRFNNKIEVYLSLIDENSNLGEGEKVWTENISVGGAAVFSDLKPEIGDCVKFIAARYEFSALAIVRFISDFGEKKSLIRLEFIAGKFPVDKLLILEKK